MDANAHALITETAERFINESATDTDTLLATILVVLNDISRTLERMEKQRNYSL
jgi:hypothetical protein